MLIIIENISNINLTSWFLDFKNGNYYEFCKIIIPIPMSITENTLKLLFEKKSTIPEIMNINPKIGSPQPTSLDLFLFSILNVQFYFIFNIFYMN